MNRVRRCPHARQNQPADHNPDSQDDRKQYAGAIDEVLPDAPGNLFVKSRHRLDKRYRSEHITDPIAVGRMICRKALLNERRRRLIGSVALQTGLVGDHRLHITEHLFSIDLCHTVDFGFLSAGEFFQLTRFVSVRTVGRVAVIQGDLTNRITAAGGYLPGDLRGHHLGDQRIIVLRFIPDDVRHMMKNGEQFAGEIPPLLQGNVPGHFFPVLINRDSGDQKQPDQ